MKTTLVIPEPIAARLRALTSLEVETGAVLLARPVRTLAGRLRLLARELHEVPEAAYERREARQLLIASDGYVPALGRAADQGCVPIWLHTHPGPDAQPRFSDHDHTVNEQLSDLFRDRKSVV